MLSKSFVLYRPRTCISSKFWVFGNYYSKLCRMQMPTWADCV